MAIFQNGLVRGSDSEKPLRGPDSSLAYPRYGPWLPTATNTLQGVSSPTVLLLCLIIYTIVASACSDTPAKRSAFARWGVKVSSVSSLIGFCRVTFRTDDSCTVLAQTT